MTWSIPDVLRRTGRNTLSRQRALLRPVEPLEDRVCPVIGAFDILGPIGAGEGYDGVARINLATGALLSTGRHLLTAAHVASAGSTAASNFVVTGPGGAVPISTPGAGFVQHPSYPGGQPDDFDIGVMPLAELAPLTAERWDLYTDTDEVGQVGRLMGYGGTGTGTIGHSTDVNPGQYWATSTGTQTNYEVVRLTITGNPTGGSFFPRLSGQVPPAQPAVPFNTNAATLAAALDALPGVSQTLVRLVGDTDFDGTVDHPGNPHAGSFEILFRGTTDPLHSLPDLVVTDNFTGGVNPGVVVETLLQGGSARIKTTGFNLVGLASADGFRLYTDFDDGTGAGSTLDDGLGQGANEGHGTWGDSGSPLFIDGQIAGVLEGLYGSVGGFSSGGGYDGLGGSGDFGEFDSWARVSTHLAFINGILDDPFDLVLNMETQPWGGDGTDDTIAVSRFGNEFRIHIGGVLRYTSPMDLIQSVTIRGSDDDETIVVSGLGEAIPVVVEGGDGDDTIRLTGLADGGVATLSGDDGDDTFEVGNGDFDTNVRGVVVVFGNGGDDTLRIDDTADAPGDPGTPAGAIDYYTFTSASFTKPSAYGAAVSFTGIQEVRLDASPARNAIDVAGVLSTVEVWVFGNGGNDGATVGGGDYDTNIRGNVHLHLGFGTDTLIIDDADDAGADTHTLGPDSYTKSSSGAVLTFQFVQSVRLDTSSSADTVNLTGTSEDVTSLVINTAGGGDTVSVHAVNAATTVTVNAGGGQDTVEVGAGDLDAIDGPVVVHGGSGTDTLTVRDHEDGGVDGYTVTAGGVAKSGFSLIFDGIQVLTLDAGVGDNTVDIDGTPTGATVTVNAGDGDDTVNVNSLAAGGLMHLFGDAGDDTFNFFAPAPEAATGGQLDIDGGAGDDTLNVYWQQPKPDIKKKKDKDDDDAGYVDLDYGGGLLYEIDYDDIEEVNVEKL